METQFLLVILAKNILHSCDVLFSVTMGSCSVVFWLVIQGPRHHYTRKLDATPLAAATKTHLIKFLKYTKNIYKIKAGKDDMHVMAFTTWIPWILKTYFILKTVKNAISGLFDSCWHKHPKLIIW